MSGEFAEQYTKDLEQKNEALLAQVEAFKDAELQGFRSHGFASKNCDIGRVYVDLPIVEAKQLIASIRK